jgi:MFS family permease
MTEPRPPGRGSLLVIFTTVFIDLLGFGLVLPLLPLYVKQFAGAGPWSGPLIGLLMASFSAMQFLFAPIWGRLSDRIGRRPVLLVGLGGSVVFYALFGLATMQQSVWLLFVGRIGAGIAGATISTAQAYIADTTTPETRARGMALIGAAFGLGFTFGPLLGAVAQWSSPDVPAPWPGFLASLLSLLATILAWFVLPESLHPSARSAAERSPFSARQWAEALAVRGVPGLLVALFVCIFAFGNFETTLSLLLKDENGPYRYDFRQVALAFAFIGLILSLVQGGLVRRLSVVLPETLMAWIGGTVLITGFGLMVLSTHRPGTALLYTAMAVCVSGFAFLMPSLNGLISRRTDADRQGAVLGVSQSVSALARILGPLVAPMLSEQNRTAPYWVGAAGMAVGLAVLAVVARAPDAPAGASMPGDAPGH